MKTKIKWLLINKIAKNCPYVYKDVHDHAVDLCHQSAQENLPSVEEIEQITYPYLAGISGALTFDKGWAEKWQKLLNETNTELAKHIYHIIINGKGR